jgi:hypothetical protein
MLAGKLIEPIVHRVPDRTPRLVRFGSRWSWVAGRESEHRGVLAAFPRKFRRPMERSLSLINASLCKEEELFLNLQSGRSILRVGVPTIESRAITKRQPELASDEKATWAGNAKSNCDIQFEWLLHDSVPACVGRFFNCLRGRTDRISGKIKTPPFARSHEGWGLCTDRQRQPDENSLVVVNRYGRCRLR